MIASLALIVLVSAAFVGCRRRTTGRLPDRGRRWRRAVGGSVVLVVTLAAERYTEGPGEPVAVFGLPFLYVVVGVPLLLLIRVSLGVGARWAARTCVKAGQPAR